MKIWSRTISDDKITRDSIYECDTLENDNMEQHLQTICQGLDIGTPIVSNTHKRHLMEFNSVRFRPSDSIDYVDYDYFEVELIVER